MWDLLLNAKMLISKPKPLMIKISSYNSYEHKKLKLHLTYDLQM